MSDRLTVDVGPRDRDGKRAVIATMGSRQEIDKFDPVSEYHRRRFREHCITRFQLGEDAHEAIEQMILDAVDASDADTGVTLATPNVVSLAGVEAKPIHWFWDLYMPAGAIVLLDGDPNEGKSQIAVDLAARVSNGSTMPPNALSGGAEPGNVLLMSAEDDVERTIVPRLKAAGARMGHVHHMRTVTPWDRPESRMVQIPLDIPVIEQIVIEKRVRLVVVDVFTAFIQDGLNPNGDSDMRHALSPLSAMLERTQACGLLLRHMNKKEGTRSMYRGGGSVAIVGAARAAFAVAPHPDDPTEKVFCAIKHNLGPKPPSLTYHIEPAGNVSRIVWGGQTELSAADVLGSHASPKGGGGGRKTEQAKGIIADLLADGPRGSNEVLQACLDAGLSERTYWTARKSLGVRAEKTEFAGNWLLTMPANGYSPDEF